MSANRKSGFTLIELLVVIAIIAILAAILFPVFAKAREAARKSTCQSNMKECAIALQTYWTDYDAMLPSSVPANNYNLDDNGFVLFSTKLGTVPPTNIPIPKTWPEMLYNSMKNRDIMFCPSDASGSDKTATSRLSYYWKFAIDKAWRDSTMKCQKEGDFGYNADQIVFYERAGFHSGAQQGLRDGVQILVSFLDSHVKTVNLANALIPATGVHLNTADDSKVMSQGEPNFFNYDNELNKKMAPNTPAGYWDPRYYSDAL